jgi:hypothetical protein
MLLPDLPASPSHAPSVKQLAVKRQGKKRRASEGDRIEIKPSNCPSSGSGGLRAKLENFKLTHYSK